MCDTFVAMPSVTIDGSVIFGKNSDREPNEAQVLEFHPGAVNALPSTVQCTYLEVPQVKETYATLLSRPFWMWGSEIGANEKGVVIGNEAVWTRIQIFSKQRDELEKAWIRDALKAPSHQHLEITQDIFRQAGQKTREWTEQVRSIPVKQPQKWIYERFWKKQNQRAGIQVC